MKFKIGFTLTVILIVLFSLSTVAAGENVTCDASSSWGEIAVSENMDDGVCESLEIDNDSPSSDECVDLSVWIDDVNVTEVYSQHHLDFEVLWTINVAVTGGTAKNVKVFEYFSENLEYVSHNTTRGTFNIITGIWEIGDLTSFENESLTVLTKLNYGVKFGNTVVATTDSLEDDFSNNFYRVFKNHTFENKIKDTNPIHNPPDPYPHVSNFTEEKKHREGPQHNDHPLSEQNVRDERVDDENSFTTIAYANYTSNQVSQSKSITKNNGGLLAKTSALFSNGLFS